MPSSFGVTSRYFVTGSSPTASVCRARAAMTSKMRCIRSLDRCYRPCSTPVVSTRTRAPPLFPPKSVARIYFGSPLNFRSVADRDLAGPRVDHRVDPLEFQVISHLQVQPEPLRNTFLSTVLAVIARVPVTIFIDSTWRDTRLLGHAILADAERAEEFLLENLARMNRGQLTSSTYSLLMVIDDLDVVGITVFPTETDTPLVIDADTILALSVPNQLLESISGGERAHHQATPPRPAPRASATRPDARNSLSSSSAPGGRGARFPYLESSGSSMRSSGHGVNNVRALYGRQRRRPFVLKSANSKIGFAVYSSAAAFRDDADRANQGLDNASDESKIMQLVRPKGRSYLLTCA